MPQSLNKTWKASEKSDRRGPPPGWTLTRAVVYTATSPGGGIAVKGADVRDVRRRAWERHDKAQK